MLEYNEVVAKDYRFFPYQKPNEYHFLSLQVGPTVNAPKTFSRTELSTVTGDEKDFFNITDHILYG